MKLLLAFDGSEHARRAVEFIVAERGLFTGAAITVLYVDFPPPLRMIGAFGVDPGMPPAVPVDPAALAAPAMDRLRSAGHAVALDVREGDPGLEIAQAATEGGYTLVVVGSHGRGLLRRAVLGSVAAKVLSHCTVPALIVR